MDHISRAASFLTVQHSYGETLLRSEYSRDPVSPCICQFMLLTDCCPFTP